MDFSLSTEQEELQSVARRFAQENMLPIAEELEAEATPVSNEWLKKYGDMGFLGMNIPAGDGGLDRGLRPHPKRNHTGSSDCRLYSHGGREGRRLGRVSLQFDPSSASNVSNARCSSSVRPAAST